IFFTNGGAEAVENAIRMAPARRVHGRRVRYVIGDEPGQVNGMRWRPGSAQ
ncbi:tryptophan biosynthesis modulator TrpM, partial [Streptomyces griseus]|uniref:tryptophan biosynthesis modulator TrpM n=1 Tax=Streptomyces griseus TaxID=1911 RepID=UPI00374E0D5A